MHWSFSFESKPGDDAAERLETEIRHVSDLAEIVPDELQAQFDAAMDVVRAEVAAYVVMGKRIRVHAHGTEGEMDAPDRTLSIDVKAV